MRYKHTTLGNLLELAKVMEKTSYEFYSGLEQALADNREFVNRLSGIKADERMHLKVLESIQAELSDVQLQSPVPGEIIQKIERTLIYLDSLDFPTLTDTDSITEAIRILEDLEFDVVISFVDLEEIDFKFTREFLTNESLDHADRIFKAQQCLD